MIKPSASCDHGNLLSCCMASSHKMWRHILCIVQHKDEKMASLVWISSLFCTVLSSYNFYYKRIPVYQNVKNLVTQSNQGSTMFEVFTAMILNDSGLLDCYTVPSSDFDSLRLINPESEHPVIPSKSQELFTQLHSIPSQKTWIFKQCNSVVLLI